MDETVVHNPEPGLENDNDSDSPVSEKSNGRIFTQDEVNAIVKQRLARQEAQWKQKLEEERQKAVMDEAERLRAETEAAKRTAETAQQQLQRERVNAALTKAIAGAGIRADRIDYALRLIDVSDAVLADGSVDEKTISERVQEFVKTLPEWTMDSRLPERGGDDYSRPPKGKPALTLEQIASMPTEELKARMPEVEAFLKTRRIKE